MTIGGKPWPKRRTALNLAKGHRLGCADGNLRVYCTLREELFERVRERAVQDGTSFNGAVVKLLTEALGEGNSTS